MEDQNRTGRPFIELIENGESHFYDSFICNQTKLPQCQKTG